MRMRIASLALALTVAAGRAGADPTAVPIVTLPDDALGAPFWAAVRLVEELPAPYVEEEFFVEGTASVYNYATLPAVRGDVVEIPELSELPYKTRIIVRRPADPADFDGTVVIEWMNSTSGFDVSTVWDLSAEYFAREGKVYVGWTNSNQSLAFLLGGCRPIELLPASCGSRYESLVISENGQAYEIGSQIATLLRDPQASPLPEGYDVERVYHAGQSQQGGSMVTYASAFHLPGVNDGYFIQNAGTARAINGGEPCGPAAPPFPDCTPVLEDDQRLVDTDLPVPVVRMQTETDLALLGVLGSGTRQEDTPNFRYYEIAGGAHSPFHDVELFGVGIPISIFCAEELNSMGDGPVFVSYVVNAMWENLERQVIDGVPPPRGEPVKSAGGEIARDAFGNALGGIRLPELDVPVATYGPTASVSPTLPPFVPAGLANLFCRLTGTVEPFSEALLGALYPTPAAFREPYLDATQALVETGFLLPEDAAKLVQAVPEPGPALLGAAALASLALSARTRRKIRDGRREAR